MESNVDAYHERAFRRRGYHDEVELLTGSNDTTVDPLISVYSVDASSGSVDASSGSVDASSGSVDSGNGSIDIGNDSEDCYSSDEAKSPF